MVKLDLIWNTKYFKQLNLIRNKDLNNQMGKLMIRSFWLLFIK